MPHPRSIQRTYLVLLLGSTLAGRGQAVTGAAMLTGSVAGGFIAEQTSVGVPFALRGVVLAVMFAVALELMRDVGFTRPRPGGPWQRCARSPPPRSTMAGGCRRSSG